MLLLLLLLLGAMGPLSLGNIDLAVRVGAKILVQVLLERCSVPRIDHVHPAVIDGHTHGREGSSSLLFRGRESVVLAVVDFAVWVRADVPLHVPSLGCSVPTDLP